jgi:hypothetical protein
MLEKLQKLASVRQGRRTVKVPAADVDTRGEHAIRVCCVRWGAMREMLSGRLGKLAVAAAVVLVAVVLLGHRGGPSKASVAGAADTASAGLQGNRAAAEGANAEVLLRSASTAMETLFAERQTFDGALAALPQVEPNVTWLGAGPADASQNQVAVTAAGTAYTLSSTTPAGATYVYARDGGGVATRTCGPGCTW